MLCADQMYEAIKEDAAASSHKVLQLPKHPLHPKYTYIKYSLLTAELFSPNVREAASSLATMTNWTTSFIITLTFEPLQVQQTPTDPL